MSGQGDLPASGRVAIIVLSYDHADYTTACLDLLTATGFPPSDIWVVDNNSSPETVAVLKAMRHGVRLRLSEVNLGWAGGNNLGLAEVMAGTYEYVLLLNNDTLVRSEVVTGLVTVADALGDVFVHPVIRYADGRPQLDPRAVGGSGVSPQGFPDVWELDYIYGACLLVPLRLFREIGVFDERYFLQLEETDLFERARRRGYRAYCATAHAITHFESVSFGGRTTPTKVYYIVRNTLLFSAKHDRPIVEKLRRLRSLVWSLKGIAQRDSDMAMPRWLLSNSVYARAMRRGVLDHLRGRYGRLDVGAGF